MSSKELLQKNRLLSDDALTDKINRLGHCAGLTTESQQTNETSYSDPLCEALRILANEYKLPWKNVENLLNENEQLSVRQRIRLVAEKNKWRLRPITLSEDFYRESSRPLLAFYENKPVVLYLKGNRSYFVSSEEPGKKQELTKKNAVNFVAKAYCFYEPLPKESGQLRALLKFVFNSACPTMSGVLLISLVVALLGLMMPIATQYITGKIIPGGIQHELMQISLLLLVLTVAEILLSLVPQLIMMIFSTQQYERFQAAVYDHILRVPVKTFRQYESGDLTMRVLAAAQIQNTVFSVINQQLIGSLFTIVSLGMMFYYNTKLATWGVVLVLVYVAIFFCLALRNLKPLGRATAARGRMGGFLQQFFSGMNKVRSAGAERQVVNRFMDDFSDMTAANYQAGRCRMQQQLFSTAFTTGISVVFYALAGGYMDKTLALPVFLAFMSAFQSFQKGLLDFAESAWTLLAIKPELDRIMPILSVASEDGDNRNDVGELTGKIEVSHLKFRYDSESPLVLDDVSFYADPGEFIAIVGPSGAGKSSLMRLLLGFETPEAGVVYYSDKDLANLDCSSVRRQLGVIMQSSQIMPGSILDNIILGTDYTMKDAWQALDLAVYADEVAAMPMNIHTLVTPGTISGGQQQRILIARALVGRPKAVLMDESTSALDNISQEKITKNMEELAMTRIVIAHRLSTIVNADRIYVLDKGKVVQCGTYSELSSCDGVFKELIQRQKTRKD